MSEKKYKERLCHRIDLRWEANVIIEKLEKHPILTLDILLEIVKKAKENKK